MIQKKNQSDENIHLSSFLPSNVLNELDENHQNITTSNYETDPNVSKYSY